MSVLAVDPGKTTGWATYHPDERWFRSDQMDFEHFVDTVCTGVAMSEITAIVAERYTVTAETLRKTRQTDALEIIGFLRATAYRHAIPFTLQAPGDAKRFSTNSRLDMIGWLRRPLSAWDHANDGARHLMLYLVKNRIIEPVR